MTSGEDMKAQSTQADEAGEQFVKLYYETIDKSRHKLAKVYMETSTLLWNGTQSAGVSPITAFLDNLPTSKHTIEAIDVQPIPAAVGQKSIQVCTTGTVVYHEKKPRGFMQNFILTAQGTTWKVLSDSFRTFE